MSLQTPLPLFERDETGPLIPTGNGPLDQALASLKRALDERPYEQYAAARRRFFRVLECQRLSREAEARLRRR